MPVISPKVADWYKSSVSSALDILPDASIELARANKWPNQYAQVIGEDGEPTGWDLGWDIEAVTGHHVYFTLIGGKRPYFRQTTAPLLPSEESWAANGPIVAGVRNTRRVKVKPNTPEGFIEADTTRGFQGGTHGYAYGFKGAEGRTTVSGEVFFTVGNSQVIPCPLPESYPVGATHIDLYIRRPGGSAPRLQRSVPIDRLRGRTTVTLRGPWRAGITPPATNESGVGVPKTPRMSGPQRFRDIYQKYSEYHLWAGQYRFGLSLENARGQSLVSILTDEVVVTGSTERYQVKVPVPAEGNVTPGETAASASARPDPRDIRPSGKHPDAYYHGEEVDYHESGYVGGINASRAQAGKDILILTQSLNRAAYRKALGAPEPIEELAREEGYEGEVATVPPAQALAKKWRAVGIAIEHGERGSETVLVVGTEREPVPDSGTCEFRYVETAHEEVDGQVYAVEVEADVRAQATLGWDLVSAGKMGWTYSGSFTSYVDTGMGRWVDVCGADVFSGGSQCAITDGAPNPGAIATTYSDGRIVINASLMSSGTDNAKRAVITHEGGHTLGLAHDEGDSVMRSSITLSSTTNIESPTSADISQAVALHGAAGGAGGGTGGGTGGETWTDDPADPTDAPKQQYRMEWREKVLPYKENTAWMWETPRILKRRDGLRWVPWVQIDNVAHRAYNKRSPRGQSRAFGKERRGILIHGYPSDAEPVGLRIGLVQEDFPAEDTSILESPDPQTLPDAPVAVGATLPAAGTYRARVSEVYESGAESILSDPAIDLATSNPFFSVGANQIMNVAPIRTINRLKNAEFSLLNAQGSPKHWTITQATTSDPGSFRTDQGVLTIGSGPSGGGGSTSQSAAPGFYSDRVFISNTEAVTIAGTLTAGSLQAGRARLVVDELDAAGVAISGAQKILGEITSNGSLPFTFLYGAGGAAWDANTDSIRIRGVMVGAGGQGTDTVNMVLSVEDLRILPYSADVRKVLVPPAGSGEPASFTPPAATPVTGGAYRAVGPAPAPIGSSPSGPVPYTVETFESGNFGAGWTTVGGGATNAVETAAALFGTYGFRVEDASTTGNGWHYRYYTLPADKSTVGNRTLLKVVTRPAYGYVAFNPVSDNAGDLIAIWRLYYNGALTAVYWDGSAYLESNVSNVAQGDTVDIEMLVTGAGTKNGSISAAIGKNGNPRYTPVSIGGLDLRNRYARRVGVGTSNASDNRAKYNFYFDQVAVTPTGDVLDRENPPPPSGYTPPAPDIPTRVLPAAWTAKSAVAAGGATTGTAYPASRNIFSGTAGTTGPTEPAWNTAQGAVTRDNQGLTAVARSNAYSLGAAVLKPGGATADNEWYEVTAITGGGATAATAPAYPTTAGETVVDGEVTFTTRATVVWTQVSTIYRDVDSDGMATNQLYVFIPPGQARVNNPARFDLLDEPLPVKPGLSYTVACFSRYAVFEAEAAPGIKVWLEGPGMEPLYVGSVHGPQGGGMSGTRAWAEDALTFSVPAMDEEALLAGDPFGYTQARVEMVLHSGVYVFQDFLHAEGALATTAARDAKRGYGRAAAGTFSVALPKETPNPVLAPGTFLSRVHSEPSVPAGTSASILYASSTSGVVYADETDDPAMVKERNFIRVNGTLTGDGREGASIPAGNVLIETWHPIGNMTRSDRSEFAGGAWIGNGLYETRYPDASVDRIQGHVYTVELSDDIMRLPAFDLVVCTEDAAREIEERSLRDEFVIEMPLAGDRVAGKAYRVRFRKQLIAEVEGTSGIHAPGSEYDQFPIPRHQVYAKFSVGQDEAEVLEAAPLIGIREQLLTVGAQ